MSITEDLRTYLLTQESVTNLLVNRIYYDALRQGSALPASVMELTHAEIMDRHLSGTGSAYRSQVTVYSYASSRPACNSLRDALIAAIEFDTGTWGSTNIERAFCEYWVDLAEEPPDGSGQWRYLSGIFTAIWHD